MEGFVFFKGRKGSNNGVGKNQSNKSNFAKFFEIFFRKFWKLMSLNVLYLIFCIPIVTIGPATAAFTKILKSYCQERNVTMLSDFIDAFKKNFKQSFIIGLIDILLVAIFVISVPYYFELANKSSFFIFTLGISIFTIMILVMMHFYLYLMIVSTELKLSQILKNSLILAISELKKNAITFFITLLVIAIFVATSPYSIPIIPFMPLSFLGLMICFNTYPIIRKQIIQPFYDLRGELNPEFSNLNPHEEVKSVFIDKGGK